LTQLQITGTGWVNSDKALSITLSLVFTVSCKTLISNVNLHLYQRRLLVRECFVWLILTKTTANARTIRLLQGQCFCTFNALVCCLEVRFKVLRTRLVLGEFRIRYSYLTASSTGAACVGQLEDVGLTSEMSVVELDTSADTHATVLCLGHNDHFVQSTGRVKRLGLAEWRVICRC